MKKIVVQIKVQKIRVPLLETNSNIFEQFGNYKVLSEIKLQDHAQFISDIYQLPKSEYLLIMNKIKKDLELNLFFEKLNTLSSDKKSNILLKYYYSFPNKIINISSLPINKKFFSDVIKKNTDFFASLINNNLTIEELSVFSESFIDALIENGISLKKFNFLDIKFSNLPDIKFTKLINITSLILTPSNEYIVLGECLKMSEFGRGKLFTILVESNCFSIDYLYKVKNSTNLSKEFTKILENKIYKITSLDSKPYDSSQGLLNIKVCITGTLSKPRKYYETILLQLGAIPQDTVNRQTNLLVTNNPNSNSNKNLNARKLGIQIIDEIELQNLINKQGVTKNVK